MSGPDTDKVFAGSIPKLYEQYLVPLIFEPYAVDLANRVASRPRARVLEVAAGTGVVTRKLASALAETVAIVATDLNQPMLDLAASLGTARPLEWRQADAMQLPFEDGTFDAVVCQFGVMFFPDKSKAFSEARRVLRPGGVFLFNVWDRIEDNEFPHCVTTALVSLFPDDPPRFMARMPHGYHDQATIARDLHAGGFVTAPRISTVTARSRAASPRIPAIAFCQGTPLRSEIEARGKERLGEATDIATQAIARRFGDGAVDGKIQAHVVEVERSSPRSAAARGLAVVVVAVAAAVLGGLLPAQAKAAPCNSAEHRAFDFWLGDWQVTGKAGKIAGSNKITSDYGGCVVHEHYATPGGYSGESLNIYDSTRKLWHQTWVDSGGTLLLLDGGLRDGKMVLEGQTVGADGKNVKHRITWTPNDDGSVRQFWETTDATGQWTVTFDGLYTRK